MADIRWLSVGIIALNFSSPISSSANFTTDDPPSPCLKGQATPLA